MAAVLYASATGATELRHLGYLERLGLWGPGRPHQSFEELRNALEGGGDGVPWWGWSMMIMMGATRSPEDLP